MIHKCTNPRCVSNLSARLAEKRTPSSCRLTNNHFAGVLAERTRGISLCLPRLKALHPSHCFAAGPSHLRAHGWPRAPGDTPCPPLFCKNSRMPGHQKLLGFILFWSMSWTVPNALLYRSHTSPVSPYLFFAMMTFSRQCRS